MSNPYNLQRFTDAQQGVFETAIAELRAGSKLGHWMWFIFPQLVGLSQSPTAKYYGIASLGEARAYLQHPILARRLREAIDAILPWAGRRTPEQVLGPVDALKLRSSLTLFAEVERDSLFVQALTAFYGGKRDERTLALLNGER